MKNILIVDDEETILVTMVEWFASAYPAANYNILAANNGIEAIKILSANKIDLLITDLNMPKMDGFELLTHMNNDYKSVPVIVVSAFGTADIKNKVKNMGAIRFISKPFTFEDLEEIDFASILDPAAAPTKESKGYINGISLQSFLQLINIESKTCTLTVKSKGKSGLIYIDKGELLNARTAELEGNKAAQEIIGWSNDGLTIEIENRCPETEKKVAYTIMSLLMESARLEDERSATAAGIGDEDEKEAQQVKEATAPAAPPRPASPGPPPLPAAAPARPVPPPAAPESNLKPGQGAQRPTAQATSAPVSGIAAIDLDKLDLVKIQARIKEFAALDGFSGAVLSTAAGDILQVVSTESSTVNLEQAAVFANNILATSHNSAVNMKLAGGINMVQVDTPAGYMLISGKDGINILLILATSNSLGLGKIMTSRTLKELHADMAKHS
jgi:CheY-like chemotaxis protein